MLEGLGFIIVEKAKILTVKAVVGTVKIILATAINLL
jgi:hypothetical protein